MPDHHNSQTTRALLALMEALSFTFILGAKMASLRGRTQRQIDAIKILATAGLIDLDGDTALERLLQLDGRATGPLDPDSGDHVPYREYLIESVGVVAAEIVDRFAHVLASGELEAHGT